MAHPPEANAASANLPHPALVTKTGPVYFRKVTLLLWKTDQAFSRLQSLSRRNRSEELQRGPAISGAGRRPLSFRAAEDHALGHYMIVGHIAKLEFLSQLLRYAKRAGSLEGLESLFASGMCHAASSAAIKIKSGETGHDLFRQGAEMLRSSHAVAPFSYFMILNANRSSFSFVSGSSFSNQAGFARLTASPDAFLGSIDDYVGGNPPGGVEYDGTDEVDEGGVGGVGDVGQGTHGHGGGGSPVEDDGGGDQGGGGQGGTDGAGGVSGGGQGGTDGAGGVSGGGQGGTDGAGGVSGGGQGGTDGAGGVSGGGQGGTDGAGGVGGGGPSGPGDGDGTGLGDPGVGAGEEGHCEAVFAAAGALAGEVIGGPPGLVLGFAAGVVADSLVCGGHKSGDSDSGGGTPGGGSPNESGDESGATFVHSSTYPSGHGRSSYATSVGRHLFLVHGNPQLSEDGRSLISLGILAAAPSVVQGRQ